MGARPETGKTDDFPGPGSYNNGSKSLGDLTQPFGLINPQHNLDPSQP